MLDGTFVRLWGDMGEPGGWGGRREMNHEERGYKAGRVEVRHWEDLIVSLESQK